MTADQRATLKLVFATYAVVFVAVAVLVRINVTLALVGNVGSAGVAILLLYTPVFVAWRFRKGEDLADYGFHADPVGKGLGYAAGAIVVAFPIFLVGFVSFFQLICHTQLREIAPGGMCGRFLGWSHAKGPTIDRHLLSFAFVQLIVVALPEELFFRGFLHHLLETVFPPKRRFLGGGIGIAMVISAACFALIHVPRFGDPRSLATFFPGLLFAWLRSATGSILAGTVVHASSNVFIRVLNQMFLR